MPSTHVGKYSRAEMAYIGQKWMINHAFFQHRERGKWLAAHPKTSWAFSQPTIVMHQGGAIYFSFVDCPAANAISCGVVSTRLACPLPKKNTEPLLSMPTTVGCHQTAIHRG